jgi:hypothetical protein
MFLCVMCWMNPRKRYKRILILKQNLIKKYEMRIIICAIYGTFQDFVNLRHKSKKNSSRICKKTFYLKYTIGFLDGSKLIQTKINIKNYVKYLKRDISTKFTDSTQNHKKMARTPNRKFSRKKYD